MPNNRLKKGSTCGWNRIEKHETYLLEHPSHLPNKAQGGPHRDHLEERFSLRISGNACVVL